MPNVSLDSIDRDLMAKAPGWESRIATSELLERFTTLHDVVAFRALVERYGAMVLSVCQRVLRNRDDAEDAFQATFLVFLRKAASLRQPERLGNWLYGVAYRTALRAKAQASKRRAKEMQIAKKSLEASSSHDVIWADLSPVLDEEVNRLPDKYRLPFVLCYLEGLTNEAAARVIGCPKGTVLSRLAWARNRLRIRLSRRDVVLSAGLLAVLVTQHGTSASVPSALLHSIVTAAILPSPGNIVANPAVSPRAGALADGILKTMFRAKLGLVLSALVVLLGGTGVVVYHFHAAELDSAKIGVPFAGRGLLKIEKGIAIKDLPNAVVSALKNQFPRATIQEVVEVSIIKGNEEKPDHYEVTIETADKKTHEVIVSLDGTTITQEAELQNKE